MKDIELYLKNLTGKDEQKAQEAACYLIDNVDIELFNALVEKTDFLFDFVRNNVSKRITKAVNKDNCLNLLKFLNVYSSYYDDLFASILAKHANEDLTDEIFELLEDGTNSQKAYAAKYFSYIPDTVSIELLSKYAFFDDESLSYNAAEALGQMNDDISFGIALSNLNSEDDFEQLKAVKFFVAYGRDYPFNEIFTALKKSKMPENIAGQIPYMISICELLNSKKMEDALCVLDNIFSGLGEILPLSDIFQFELFEAIEFLMNQNKQENAFSGKIAEVLLKAYSKFKLFTENPEYIFDEDKDTKYEISSIYKLMQSFGGDFWKKQKQFILAELESSDDRVIEALSVIVEFNLTEAADSIKKLLDRENEILLCEALSTLKQIGAIAGVDIDSISCKIKNDNIKAIIENLKG
jgi:hypothetical protein